MKNSTNHKIWCDIKHTNVANLIFFDYVKELFLKNFYLIFGVVLEMKHMAVLGFDARKDILKRLLYFGRIENKNLDIIQ